MHHQYYQQTHHQMMSTAHHYQHHQQSMPTGYEIALPPPQHSTWPTDYETDRNDAVHPVQTEDVFSRVHAFAWLAVFDRCCVSDLNNLSYHYRFIVFFTQRSFLIFFLYIYIYRHYLFAFAKSQKKKKKRKKGLNVCATTTIDRTFSSQWRNKIVHKRSGRSLSLKERTGLTCVLFAKVFAMESVSCSLFLL